MRALVIDDSRAIRSVLTKMLKEFGFEVFEAGQGLDGLDQLRNVGKIDLALVDWNMPEMNGYQFVCAVRSNPAYNNLRLMMVTTESELSQMVSVLNAGADEYVMKPFTREIIFEKLCLLNLSGSGKNATN